MAQTLAQPLRVPGGGLAPVPGGAHVAVPTAPMALSQAGEHLQQLQLQPDSRMASLVQR